jgi:hypothetical protein
MLEYRSGHVRVTDFGRPEHADAGLAAYRGAELWGCEQPLRSNVRDFGAPHA